MISSLVYSNRSHTRTPVSVLLVVAGGPSSFKPPEKERRGQYPPIWAERRAKGRRWRLLLGPVPRGHECLIASVAVRGRVMTCTGIYIPIREICRRIYICGVLHVHRAFRACLQCDLRSITSGRRKPRFCVLWTECPKQTLSVLESGGGVRFRFFHSFRPFPCVETSEERYERVR